MYLYIQADYVSPTGLNSSSILSDWILESYSPKALEKWNFEFNSTWADYPLRDVYNNLQGQEVTFRVMVEYMPHVGAFFKRTLAEKKYRMPAQYQKTSY